MAGRYSSVRRCLPPVAPVRHFCAGCTGCTNAALFARVMRGFEPDSEQATRTLGICNNLEQCGNIGPTTKTLDNASPLQLALLVSYRPLADTQTRANVLTRSSSFEPTPPKRAIPWPSSVAVEASRQSEAEEVAASR